MANIVNNGFYQTYINGPVDGNRNQFIQRVSDRLMENTCPIVLRRFKEAEYSYESKNLNQPDGQNIRIRILVASTVGTLICLANRIVRTAVRTLALPVSLACLFRKQQYYGIQGEVTEELKRVTHEWVDLGVSLILPFVGIVKFFKPDALHGFNEYLVDYYIRRIDQREAHDRYVTDAVATYRIQGEVTKELNKVTHEWVDLGVSLILSFIGIVKFFIPDALQGFNENLIDYYNRHID